MFDRISYKKTDKPGYKWLRATTSDYNWLRARLRVTTRDYESTSDYKSDCD